MSPGPRSVSPGSHVQELLETGLEKLLHFSIGDRRWDSLWQVRKKKIKNCLDKVPSKIPRFPFLGLLGSKKGLRCACLR